MKELRFAVMGAGFWSQFQIAAWGELPGARCVAIYNRTKAKAEILASRFNIPAVYEDAAALFRNEQIDFVDIITDVNSHAPLAHLAAEHHIPVICQKPLAPSLAAAEEMVIRCRAAGVPLLVHENWRWQAPIRALKQVLDSGAIGHVFRAHVQFTNSFPVFDNQSFLKTLDQFILADMGTHMLDAVRYLFGELSWLTCTTTRVHTDIRGEDVATVMLSTDETTVLCSMSYASRIEHDRFPETFIFVEGDRGSAEIAPDYWLRTTTSAGTQARRVPPRHYSWADPAYDLVHASIVSCQANLLAALRGEAQAETTAEDNLRTLRLVYAAYESARTRQTVSLE
jgi:predicted dehydrogenase